MIISHRHRMIFIKTRKTAGTSFEVALAKICGSEDIVTPVIPEVPGHVPRNFQGFYNHMPASHVAQALPSDQFNGYFKFCFERHPYTKTASQYYMLKNSKHHQIAGHGNRLTPAQFLALNKLPLDRDKYTADGKIIVDMVFKYEQLDESIEFLSERIGTPLPALEHIKSGFRETSDPRALFNDRQLEQIAKEFAFEFDQFGYAP